MELLVPTISDVIFKYTWPIPRYKKSISKKSLIDSPSFKTNVNSVRSSWNLSIRFWKDPDGRRIVNPVVLCLNMLSCNIDEAEQAKIRFQFGIFNAELKHWEYCHVNRTILELKSCTDIISLGYKDLSIVDRHIKKNGEVLLMVKIQIIQCDNEKHNLSQDVMNGLINKTQSLKNYYEVQATKTDFSQDMARLLKRPLGADTKLLCGGLSSTEIPVHSNIIAARSNVLADMISPLGESQMKEILKVNTEEKVLDMENVEEEKGQYKFVLELLDLSTDVTEELLRYMYTDHIDNLDTLAPQLLSLAERFCLQGLKELCERNLIETINPENIASRLLVADEFHCGALKRASLTYCEENVTVLNKSLAWKMMEHVNPELFNEVCEASIGSSRSSNMDDSELSN